MANKTRVYGDEVIREIVHRYIEETDSTGNIEYSSIRDFAFKLWENKDPIFTEKMYYQLIDKETGEASKKIYKNIKLSDDFWRKPQYQGRKIVDEINEFYSETVAKSTKRQVAIPNFDSIFETHKHNMTQLYIHLKPYEEYLKNSLQNEEKLEEKIVKLEDTITKLTEKNMKTEQQSQRLQTALYQMFEYSTSKGVPLENQLNTGKGKTKRVEQALRETFSGDPSSFYSKFKGSSEKQNEETNVANMADFVSSKQQQPIPKFEDEYDF